MDIFTAVADQTRRDIVEMLARRGQLTATQISSCFTATPSAISQHLKVLRESKVVSVKKNAQQRLYTLNPQSIHRLAEWCTMIEKIN